MKKVKPLSQEKCSYCAKKAEWKSTTLNFIQYTCDDHKQSLDTQEVINNDSINMSEGEWQAFGKHKF